MDYSSINNVWAFLAFFCSSIFGLFQYLTMQETKKIASNNHQHQSSLENILKTLQEEIILVSHTAHTAYNLSLNAHKRIDDHFQEQYTPKIIQELNISSHIIGRSPIPSHFDHGHSHVS